MKATVLKQSVRELTKRKRLPRCFRMFVAGCWLYDILKANGLHEQIHLKRMSYWVGCRSLDSRHLVINWEDSECPSPSVMRP